VHSKSDLGTPPGTGLSVSAHSGFGISTLLSMVYDEAVRGLDLHEPSVIATQRQYDCVKAAADYVNLARRRLAERSLELAAEEVRCAAASLQELTGKIVTDDILDQLFGRFCLGK
jgi:tRNA modification GTPase